MIHKKQEIKTMKKMTERKRKKLEWKLALLQANSISFRYNFGDEFDEKSNKYVAEFLLNNDYYSDMTDDDLIALIEQMEYNSNIGDNYNFTQYGAMSFLM